MKIRRTFIVIVFLASLLFQGCKKENMCDCVKSTGDVVKVKRSLSDFEELEVNKNVIVTLYQDTSNYTEVEAGSHLIDLIRTDVDGGVLKITNDNTCNWVRSYDIEVHVRVHLKKLSKITHYGSEQITSGNTIVTPSIEVYEDNSADIHLTLESDRVSALQMVGGGDIYLSGYCHFNYDFAQSFGYIYAKDLMCDSALVDHRGSGDIHVHPNVWTKVNINDRGNVYYSGQPSHLESYLNSSGKLYQE